MNATADIATITAKLSEFDFIVVVDASGSMSTEDCPGNRSRWAYMEETLTAFARDVDKIDSDGLGLIIFGGQDITATDGVTADKVASVFGNRRPSGDTPLAEALTAALNLGGGAKADKKRIIVVFTDGIPRDAEAVQKVIIAQANSQANDDDCTILFVQVGHDAAATKYLTHLDDGLTKLGAKFDIVDAKTITEAEKYSSTAALVFDAITG